MATIREVAAVAGVSRSTVSLVLNDSPLVKAETREHVLSVIREMKYVPNNNARSLSNKIMNSLGVTQSVTDRDRAQISLSYHCVSLNDVYWVRVAGEEVTFASLNLYDNPLNEAIVPLPLKGKHLTVTNRELAPDLSTKGCFPKAWIRSGTEFRLLKDGGEEVVRRELLASK